MAAADSPPPVVRPLARIVADPPAALAATGPMVAATGSGAPLGTGLTPQPSGRLPLQPALIEALAAALGFAPTPGAVPANPPVPAQAPNGMADVGVPLASAVPGNQTKAFSAFAEQHVRRAPSRSMLESPMKSLLARLMPASPSAFGLPQRFGELRAQPITWVSAQSLAQRLADELSDNSVGIAAVVMAALVTMTAMTAAGAGLSGRPLRHTAWRTNLRRFGVLSEWGTALPDTAAAADGVPHRQPPEPRVTAWPGRPMAEPAATPGERRVA